MRKITLIAALAAALTTAACQIPNLREAQRADCIEDGGHYIAADEYDDDLCVLPGNEVRGYDFD